MRPNPCRSLVSTHWRKRSCALTIRPQIYSASPSPPSARRFQITQTGPFRQFQCLPMFPQAAFDVALRENTNFQLEMNATLLRNEAVSNSHPLGLLEIGERS